MAIYQTAPGEFVISAQRTWLCGVYASASAARYAFRLSDDERDRIWESHKAEFRRGSAPAITFEKMRAMAHNASPISAPPSSPHPPQPPA